MVRVSPEQLSEVISNELRIYSSDITEGMKKVNDKCMREFVKQTKHDAPKGRRQEFYKNISSKTTLDTPNKKINTWYVKDPEYRLTHLIKNGHATRDGGRTRAQDFLTHNYERLEREFEDGIKEVINNGH